jgi:hypothetical protein
VLATECCGNGFAGISRWIAICFLDWVFKHEELICGLCWQPIGVGLVVGDV